MTRIRMGHKNDIQKILLIMHSLPSVLSMPTVAWWSCSGYRWCYHLYGDIKHTKAPNTVYEKTSWLKQYACADYLLGPYGEIQVPQDLHILRTHNL